MEDCYTDIAGACGKMLVRRVLFADAVAGTVAREHAVLQVQSLFLVNSLAAGFGQDWVQAGGTLASASVYAYEAPVRDLRP